MLERLRGSLENNGKGIRIRSSEMLAGLPEFFFCDIEYFDIKGQTTDIIIKRIRPRNPNQVRENI